MKKGRMYLLISISILALYLGSCLVMYLIARSTAQDNFVSKVSYDYEKTETFLYNERTASYKTPFGLISDLTDCLNEDTYAFQYHLIRGSNEIAASGGSFIVLYGNEENYFQEAGIAITDIEGYEKETGELFLDISDLLTDEMRKFFLNTYNVNHLGLWEYYTIDELTYYTSGNTIIPISITFDLGSIDSSIVDKVSGELTSSSIALQKNGNLTLTFSDHSPDGCLHFTQHFSIVGELYLDTFDCAYFGEEISRISKRIRQDFSGHLNPQDSAESDNYAESWVLSEYETVDYAIKWDNRDNQKSYKTAYVMRNITLNDIPYKLVLTIGQDLNYETLHSVYFRQYVISAGLLFLLLLIIVLSVSGKIYDKNRQLNEARDAFTSAVAHELKTPLVVIQSQCECMMEGVAPEKNEEYLSTIYKESRRMNHMVLTFLKYNRLRMTSKVEMEKENLSSIIREETDKYLPLLEDEDRNVKIEIEDNLCGMVNADLFRLAIDNFLSNAAKYTAPSMDSEQCWIGIRLMKNKKGFCFCISNSCDNSNIPTDSIWNLLTRTDASRHRDQNSTGMGLAVAAEILKLHKMKYECRKVNGGIRFTIAG